MKTRYKKKILVKLATTFTVKRVRFSRTLEYPACEAGRLVVRMKNWIVGEKTAFPNT